MKRLYKIIIIILSVLLLLSGVLWGGFEYLSYSSKYPFIEFDKIKKLIQTDSEKAATQFIELNNKIDKKRNPNKYKDKQKDYIVNYIEVLSITQCEDSIKSEKDFLYRLWENGNAETKEMVMPYIYYQKVINANTFSAKKTAIREFIGMLKESAQFDNKAERFGLLICTDLDSICPNESIRDSLYNCIKRNLINTKFENETKQVWQQFMLSYCYYLEYKKHRIDNPDSDTLQYLLSKITETLPIKFYTNFHLEEKAIGISHIQLVLENVNYYLKSGNKEQAYKVLSNLTFKNPFEYFDYYTSLYEHIEGAKLTDEVWFESLQRFMPIVPDIQYTSLTGDILDLSQKRDKWLLIDFWGTWCAPCVKQMPEIQAFYEKNKTIIDVFTISKNSKNLENFLSENSYSFPVADVDKIIGFEINSFPTKLLVSPNGNYIEVPNIYDWINYVRKITRIDEIK